MTKGEKAVHILDMFTKTWCIKTREPDLKFECSNCPFANKDGSCMVKVFKSEKCPNYEYFGSMF